MATIKPFSLVRGAPDFGGYIDAKALAASVNEDVTVPAGAEFVLFSSTADFYAKAGGSATVPGDTADGTAAELNPTLRRVKGIATIGLITAAAGGAIVTMVWYSGGG